MKTYTIAMFNLFMFSLSNWFSYLFATSLSNKVSVYVFFPSVLLFCYIMGYYVWGNLTELFEEMIENYEEQSDSD